MDQIDVFVAGFAIGLAVGGLFAYWAIRAFMHGFREGIEKRAREQERKDLEREREEAKKEG